MEDPWSSPWATDTPPKIDLPAAPPSAHFPISASSPGRKSTSRERSSTRGSGGGWNIANEGGFGADNDDAWGGWSAPEEGKMSPGWGRSPGLKPAVGDSSGRLSPVPWGRLPVSESRRSDLTVDSAISLGDDTPRKDSSDMGPLGNTNKVSGSVWDIQGDELKEARKTEPFEEPSPSLGDAETRPKPERQASKVQGLVDLYDGLSSPSEVPTPTMLDQQRRPSQTLSLKTGVEELSTDDQTSSPESFPDAKAEIEEPAEGIQPIHPESPEVEISKPDDSIAEETATDSSPSIPLEFNIDLSNLDKLFDPPTPAFPDPEPIPDVIIDDTFSSIAERKAWYRLSRFGSMRKHNKGDDENYVRVSWKESQVRWDTMRIVRRWMEEDSITGKVVLGRRTGAVGASLFGWDSDAPKVDVGELLGRKNRHSRQFSQSSKASTEGSTVATFGWSTSPPASPTSPQTSRFSVETPRKSIIEGERSIARNSFPRPLSLQKSARPLSMNQVLAVPSPLIPPAPGKLMPTLKIEDEDEDEDEDDWGEMVSSPTFPTNETVGRGSLEQPPPATAPEVGIISSDLMKEPPESNIDTAKRESQDHPPVEARMKMAEAHPTPRMKLPFQDQALEEPSDKVTQVTAATPLSQVSPKKPDTKLSTSDNDVVEHILRDIPDFTYMLR